MKVPFDHKGNLMTYPMPYYVQGKRFDPVWQDDVEFTAILRIVDFERGRSAARFILTAKNGVEYPMFLKDLFEMLQVAKIIKGEVFGKWKAVKRGQNYGIAFVP